MKRRLILMAKQPIPGHTKTRLLPVLSAEAAAALYECFLQDKIAQMRQVKNVEWAIAYHPAEARAYFADLAPDFTLIQQEGADLAERLRSVFGQSFDQGIDHAVAIDSDTVTLPPDYLQQAVDWLDDPSIDVTIGGCEDGGYYAIGMKCPHPTLFEVEMSTPYVLQDTLVQAEKADLKVYLLPKWYDVDTPTDLQRLASEVDENSATGQFLMRKKVRSCGYCW